MNSRNFFLLTKGSNHRIFVRRLIYTHQFGFELRLLLGFKADRLRSRVCRSDDELLTIGEPWKAAMSAEGWN